MRLAPVLVVALVACKSKSTCDDLDRRAVDHLLPHALRAKIKDLKKLAPRLRDAVIESCTTNKWAQDTLACDDAGCRDKLTAGQRAHAEMLLAEVVRDQSGKQPEPKAPDPKDIIGSPLPDVGPDPMYPTPKRAGTQNLFTMEDPERGPKAPIDFKLPPRDSLTWTTHAHCEDDKLTPVCSPPSGAGLWSWRVGRDGKGVVVAEQLRGKATAKTFVYTSDQQGSPLERIELDSHGRVTGALLFVEGNRYTGRRRTGGNALEGCGFMKYALDANRRIAQLVCEQWLGGTMLDTDGVARTDYVRDASGFVIEEKKFGLDAKPIADKDGVSSYARDLDRDGRPATVRYRDKDGRPIQALTGCFARRIERDAQGTESKSVCLAANGAALADESGTAAIAYKNDRQGCRVGVRNLDANDAPALDHYRSHGADLVVDSHCAIKERTCLGIDGKPALCRNGEAARNVNVLDAFGRVTSAKYYDQDRQAGGDPHFHMFEVRTKYDDLDRNIEQSCWIEGGTAAQCGTTGFHRMKTTFDDVGRAIEARYFDETGQPVANYQAWIRRYRYDNYDHQFEATAHEPNGTLIEAANVATRRDLFDSAHRLFGVLLLDKQGKPARYTGCYTGVACTWKPWHALRVIRRHDGSAEKNLFFDDQGQVIETQLCTRVQCWD
jgi:hypothetical protein